MLSRLILTFALAGLLGAAGCSADLSDKLGTEGELCHVDDDCAPELLCNRGTCTDGDQDPNNGRNNGRNNGVNNGQNNGWNNGENNGWNNGQNNGWNNGQNNGWNNGQNNGWNNGENNGWNNGDGEIEQLCYEVCDHFGECTGEWDDACGEDCYDQLRQFPPDQAYDLLFCLLDSSCQDIRNGAVEQCLDGGGIGPNPEERWPYCEDISKFVADEVCPRQGVGEEIYELCIDAAEWHDDANFWRLEECIQEGCDDILECVYDWYERG